MTFPDLINAESAVVKLAYVTSAVNHRTARALGYRRRMSDDSSVTLHFVAVGGGGTHLIVYISGYYC